MGYLKLIKYFFAGGLNMPRYLKIWSDLVNSKYLGNKKALTKVNDQTKWVTKTNILAHFTLPQASHPSELAGLTKKLQ